MNSKSFILITLLVSIWVNASEVFRYFVIVMPEMRDSLAMVPDVAPMDIPVFLIWGAWDTLLTGMIVWMFWLVASVYGNNGRSVIIAGLASWSFFFVLFWVGMVNMNLAGWSLALIALPLALLETVVASFIASKLFVRFRVI